MIFDLTFEAKQMNYLHIALAGVLLIEHRLQCQPLDRQTSSTWFFVNIVFVNVSAETEIGDFNHFIRANQHISCGQVTMHDFVVGQKLLRKIFFEKCSDFIFTTIKIPFRMLFVSQSSASQYFSIFEFRLISLHRPSQAISFAQICLRWYRSVLAAQPHNQDFQQRAPYQIPRSKRHSVGNHNPQFLWCTSSSVQQRHHLAI